MSFVYKALSQIFFAWDIKGFYQSSSGNKVDFRDIMNVSRNILSKNLKFPKDETRFCKWKSTNNSKINIFLSLENPCTYLLAKEKTWKDIFDTNSELLQNCAEKQIMSSKTTINWLFNDIWCCLFIACFDWKISVFQQTAARVYYILKVGP